MWTSLVAIMLLTIWEVGLEGSSGREIQGGAEGLSIEDFCLFVLFFGISGQGFSV